MTFKIALFGAPGFCKNIIAELINSGQEVHYFMLNKDRNIKLETQANQITYINSIHETLVTDMLETFQPDYIFVASFHQKIPNEIIAIAQIEALNFHPSILPNYRGPNPLFWLLKHGEDVGGITIHRLTEQWDAGDILITHSFPINPYDTYISLAEKVCHETTFLMRKVMPSLKSRKLEFNPQGKGSYYGNIPKEDYVINWENSAKDIHNLIRALPMDTPALMLFNKQPIQIIESEISAILSDTSGKIWINQDQIYIGTNDYYLKLNIVKYRSQFYTGAIFLKALEGF
ncbi:MAG: formyltransferase family protein [Candidatus Margulisiibacteriota bacterium]